jgi:hypothetical protein
VECKHQILKSYLHYPHQHRRWDLSTWIEPLLPHS